MEIYEDGDMIHSIVVFTKPNGFGVRAHEVNETGWPGLEASCQTVLGNDLWASIKALDPIPEP